MHGNPRGALHGGAASILACIAAKAMVPTTAQIRTFHCNLMSPVAVNGLVEISTESCGSSEGTAATITTLSQKGQAAMQCSLLWGLG